MRRICILIYLVCFATFIRAQTYETDFANAVQVAPTTLIASNTDLGTCLCDLTANVCDPDCCCDTACTTAQLALVDTCLKSGVSDTTITTCANLQRINTALTSVTVSSVAGYGMCVVRVNSPTTGQYYSVPTDVTDQAIFSQKVALATYTPSVTRTGISLPSGAVYRINVPLAGRTAAGNNGFFTVPAAGFDGLCSETGFAFYDFSLSRACVRYTATLSTGCTTAFDPNRYLQDYRVLTTPSDTVGVAVTITDVQTFNPATLAITSTGSTAYGAVAYAAGTCNNALYGIDFNVTHNGAGTVIAVSAVLTLTSVTQRTDLSGVQEQKFTMSFSQSGYGLTAIPRSGNPGYLTGSVVVAGRLAELSGRAAILRDVAYGGGLSRMAAGAGGVCNSGLRTAINYGADYSGGCTLPFDISMVNANTPCQTLRTNALAYLRGAAFNFTHVGRFGSASVNSVYDWVSLTDNYPTLSTAAAVGLTCPSVPVEMKYVFLTAPAGAQINAQYAIIGARIDYAVADVTFPCFGSRCTAALLAATAPLYLQTSAVFIDGSSGILVEGVIPAPPLPPMPSDIFYPFYLQSGSAIAQPSVIVVAAAAMVVLILQSVL
eukprot:TRINITY_DN13475_c0_g1_i1.p1 TRINITY_DN13475_c0_g1~~TRINITY_DN13475_c0_g1_i1.p1  ORF type:complete len:603 (-),score=131.35 TRINITY_DN13475_c0_g1_i1:511-2319(-)